MDLEIERNGKQTSTTLARGWNGSWLFTRNWQLIILPNYTWQ